MLRRTVRYGGRRHSCPCCGGRFRRFETFRGRPQARCPRCGCLERHRVLWLYLRERTELFTSRLSVLHVAPEGLFQRRLSELPNLRYVSGDLNSPTAMVRLDVTDIDFPADSFDVILCNHVLEHVPEDRKAFGEFRRVLKPGGRAIMMHPIDYARERSYEDPSVVTPEDREREFRQHDHVRIYGRDFQGRIEEAGLDVEMLRSRDLFDEATRDRHCLGAGADDFRGDDIYVAAKPALVGEDMERRDRFGPRADDVPAAERR